MVAEQPAPHDPRPSCRRRLLRTLGVLGLVTSGVTLGLFSVPGERFLANQISEGVRSALVPGWTFATPRLHLGLSGVVGLDGVSLRDPAGREVVGLRHLALRLDLSEIWAARLHVLGVRVDGVTLDLRSDGEALDIVRAFGGPSEAPPPDPDAPPWQGLPIELVVHDVGLRDVFFALGSDDVTQARSVELRAVALSADVRFPRHAPEVHVSGLDLSGLLMQPGPSVLTLRGDAVYRDGTLHLPSLDLAIDRSAAHLSAELGGLTSTPTLAATLDVSPFDVGLIEKLFGAPMGGRYRGRLEAEGGLGAFALTGTLSGVEETRGTLSLAEGSYLCLPLAGSVGHEVCRGEGWQPPLDAPPELAWRAILDSDQFALEQLITALTGSVVIDGLLVGRGHGVTWPEGVVIEELDWTGGRDLEVYGVPLRDVEARARLIGGVLHLDRAEIGGVVGHVSGDGTLDFQSGELDIDVHGPLHLDMLRDLEVELVGGEGSFVGTVTGNIYGEGVPIDVDGDFVMAPFLYGPEVRIERLAGRFHTDVRDGITTVSATGQGEDTSAYGVTIPEVSIRELGVVVTPGAPEGTSIEVEGHVEAPTLRYGDLASFDAVSAPFTWHGGGERVPILRAQNVHVGDHQIAGLLGNRGHLDFEMTGDVLQGSVDLCWDHQPFVQLPSFTFDLSTRELDVREALLALTSRQRWRLGQPLHLRLTEGGIADAVVDLSSSFGRLFVLGDLGTSGPLSGTITTEQLDLDVVAELFPERFSGLDGVLDMDLELGGDAANALMTLDLDLAGLFYPEQVRWLDVSGTAALLDGRLRLGLTADVAGERLASVIGHVPVIADLSDLRPDHDGAADLRLVVEPGALARLATVRPGLEVPEGAASGVLSLKGDITDPDIGLQAVAVVDGLGTREAVRIELDLVREQGELRTWLDVYDGLKPLVLVDGDADTRLSEVLETVLRGDELPATGELISLVVDALDIEARDVDVPLSTLLAISGIDADVVGRLQGDLRVAGGVGKPEVTGDLTVAGVAGDQPFEVVLDWEKEAAGYGVAICLGAADEMCSGAHAARVGEAPEGVEEAWLSIDGHVPLSIDLTKPWVEWGTGDFDLAVLGQGLPLEVAGAVVPGLDVGRGALKAEGSVVGPWRSPEPSLTLGVDDALFTYKPIGLTFRQVALDAVVAGKAVDGLTRWWVEVEALTATPAPSNHAISPLAQGARTSLEARARLDLRGLELQDVSGDLDLREAWLSSTDAAKVRANGQLHMEGLWPTVAVDGDLAVSRGKFLVNVADLLAERTLILDPSITVHRGAERVVSLRREEPSLLDTLDVRVRVDLGANTEARILVPVLDDLGQVGAAVTRADIVAILSGRDLDVRMQQGDIFIGGTVGLDSGRLTILRSRFELQEGSEMVFFGRDYANPHIDVSGVMDVGAGDVQIILSGTAEDPSLRLESEAYAGQAELFTILLTGEAPEELSAQEGTVALEAVGDLLVQSTLGGVNLGSVEVAGDGTVTVSIPLPGNVHVVSAFTPVPALQENQVTVEAEWKSPLGLVVELAYGDRESWANLFYEVRFDYLKPLARKEEEAPSPPEPQ